MVATATASADDDGALDASLEALRSKFGRGRVRPTSGSRGMRKAASTASLHQVASPPPASAFTKEATDNVQTKLIASLDRDCKEYRKKIAALEKQLELAKGATSSSSTREAALQDSLAQLQGELDASLREREALTATVARLSRAKDGPAEALREANEQLAMARAELTTVRQQCAHGAAQLETERLVGREANARADAVEAKAAAQIASLEGSLSEAQRGAQQQARALATLQAEYEQAVGENASVRQQASEHAEEAARAKRAAEAAGLEASEARGESSSLARRLAAMAERRDEKEKKVGKEVSDDKERARAAAAAAAKASGEASGLKQELGAAKVELLKERDLVRNLRAKLEASKAEASAAPKDKLEAAIAARLPWMEQVEAAEKSARVAKKAAEAAKGRAAEAERKAAALEAANAELQAAAAKLHDQILVAQQSVSEARAEADGANARAAEALKGAAAPKEHLAPLSSSGENKSNFGKYQAKVQALEAEIAQLKKELDASPRRGPRGGAVSTAAAGGGSHGLPGRGGGGGGVTRLL